jgi:4-hydroxy-4-methyl-2-oxoglutarate aldolase
LCGFAGEEWVFMIHIKTRIERPSEDLVERFRTLGAATVHEASGRKGAVDPAIKPIRGGLRLCGPAFTVQCAPGDNLMLHKALEKARPGDVLVTSVSGYPEAGYWGGLMATSGVARHLGGLAIDGCIRDSAEIIEMGFPVFARGCCIRGTSKSVPGLINHPTIFGGIIVQPGDLILGDDDGLVVVERAEAESILEKALKRVEAEAKKSEQLRGGVSSVELNRLAKVFEALGLVEE